MFHNPCYWVVEIHAVKSNVPKQVNVRKYESFDPIPPVADLLVQEASLLCFDEFQVSVLIP